VLVESTEFAPKQPSVEPEHECCVHNNIRCQLEAFLFMWREIVYKVYGMDDAGLLKKALNSKTKGQFYCVRDVCLLLTKCV
jgi:hypothetical protein